MEIGQKVQLMIELLKALDTNIAKEQSMRSRISYKIETLLEQN